MKKAILIFILILSSVEIALSKSDESPTSVFHLSFVPGLSTNGLNAKDYTNYASFNILAGISRNERAFTFAGLGNIILNDAQGLQFAGFFNYVGNEGRGLLFSGLASIVKNEYNGLQFAGLFSSSGNTRGMQLAGLVSITDRFTGLQIGGLTCISDDADGMQLGGLMSIADDFRGFQLGCAVNITDSMKGTQLGGLVNISDDAKGLQFAGIINIADKFKGVQFGGLMNVAERTKGLQFAGLGNVADDIKGFQFGGLFNVAKSVRGVQFAGLVNVAENSDVPIGIINIIKNGEKSIGLTYDGNGNAMLSFRSGGKYTYGILGVGYNHLVSDNKPFSVEAGYGVHIPCTKWFRINNEVKATSVGGINSSDPVFIGSYSLMPAFRLGFVELFGGPSLNYAVDWNSTVQNLPRGKNTLWERHNANVDQQLYISYTVGLQFIF